MGSQQDWRFGRRGKSARGSEEDFLKSITLAMQHVIDQLTAMQITAVEATERLGKLQEFLDLQQFEVQLAKIEKDFG